jgi:glyoxylase-like metal-dependent hydrolase (beta-lactamase superfamily II)
MTTRMLTSPLETLLATDASRLPYQHDVLLRSFVLERPAGNAIVYNSPGIDGAAEAIHDLGGATRLLINHAHEAMYGDPAFEVPTFAHERDRVEIGGSLRLAETFDSRRMIDEDLEVIPTPGHTAGTTCYLWDSGTHRFLFTGDFIWLERGEWKAVVLGSNLRAEYLESLALVRDLDFDVLVPWGATEGYPCFAETDRADTRSRIDAIITRVRSGGDR